MTQHTWETSNGWTVLTGWDRPLQYHFLSVFKDCDCVDGVLVNDNECDRCHGNWEVWAFDNLASKDYPSGRMDPSAILKELKRLDMEFPPTLEGALREDQARDAGNEQTQWNNVGGGSWTSVKKGGW